MKRILMTLAPTSIDRAIREVEQYRKWQQERVSVFLSRLADEGYDIAGAAFKNAEYDGTNDVTVTVEDRGENVKAVVAVGKATLFIEFGTGVTYPDNHPEAAEHGMNRGEYGQGKGSHPTWGYYGEPGTNGIPKVKPNGKTVIITRGNPANMPMYQAVKELRERLTDIAREVFV